VITLVTMLSVGEWNLMHMEIETGDRVSWLMVKKSVWPYHQEVSVIRRPSKRVLLLMPCHTVHHYSRRYQTDDVQVATVNSSTL